MAAKNYTKTRTRARTHIHTLHHYKYWGFTFTVMKDISYFILLISNQGDDKSFCKFFLEVFMDSFVFSAEPEVKVLFKLESI